MQWLKRFVHEHEATAEQLPMAEADRERLFAERAHMELDATNSWPSVTR
jgi:hypothetical protein